MKEIKLATLIFLATPTILASQSTLDIEGFNEERSSSAQPTALVAPFFSIGDEESSHLVLINKTAFPISADLQVQALGDLFPIGRFDLLPRRSLTLPLEDLLSGVREVSKGSLRLDFLGDAEALQGWVVWERAGSSLEIPMKVSGTQQELSIFWDMPGSKIRPVIYVANPEGRSLSLSEGRPAEAAGPRMTLGAHGQLRKQGVAASGEASIAVIHPDDYLVAASWLAGEDGRPVVQIAPTSGQAFDVLAEGSRDPASTDRKAVVVIKNPHRKVLQLRISSLDWKTGTALASFERRVPPNSVRALEFDLGGMTSRLRIAGTEAFSTYGWVENVGSSVGQQTYSSLQFFALEDGHPNGSYPLPSLDKYWPVHYLLNLGDEPARVAFQLDWAEGSYTLGPVEIPAHGSYSLDIGQLALGSEPDLLGRKLDFHYEQGFLRWTTMNGSLPLAARLVSNTLDASDAFGFNCSQCCPQMPVGSIVPSLVELVPGETPLFQACVSYNTCNGTMGPFRAFPSAMSVPAPFYWDGIRVGLTEPANGELAFEAPAEGINFVCLSFSDIIFAKAKAEACRKVFNPFYDPKTSCIQQTSSLFECTACCHNVSQEKHCKGRRFDVVEGERRTCQQLCDNEYHGSGLRSSHGH